MVSIQHISKSFGSQKVLNDVSLEIPAGQIVGLLGPNGAGKSTLMKILIGLWSADSGTVSAPSRIGYLPENNPLYEEMYVTEYLQFMAKMTNDKCQMTNVDALIDQVGLTPARHKHIRELSKGYRQRVGLAQALLGDPQLLILDEPTTGLDPIMSDIISDLIMDLKAKLGVTSVVITHDMRSAFKIADYIAFLYEGKILMYGTPDQFRHTDNPYVKQFVDGSSKGPIQMKIMRD